MAASWGTKKKRESRTAPKSAECEKLELKNDIKPVTVELVPRIPKEELVGSFEEISVPECDVEIKEEADKSDGVSPVLERDPLQIEEHKMAATARNSARSERRMQKNNPRCSIQSAAAIQQKAAHCQSVIDSVTSRQSASHGCRRKGRSQNPKSGAHDSGSGGSELDDFTCNSCHKTFLSKYALLTHVFIHIDGVKPPQNICRLCGDIFPTQRSLQMHCLHVHLKNQCITAKKEHKLLDTNKKRSSCHRVQSIQCLRNTAEHREEDVSQRSKVQSPQDDNDITQMESSDGDSCRRSISECDTLLKHKRSRTGVAPNESHENNTSSAHLKTRAIFRTAPSPYKCSHCGRYFKCQVYLQQHLPSHQKKPIVCDTCGRTFKRPVDLRQHVLSHTGEKPYVCGCGKSFAKSYSLKRHEMVHRGERPFRCDMCSKTFTDAGVLKKHALVHTGERAHMCGECGKAFKEVGHLKRHSMLHTGEKPYVCRICGMSFTQSASLTTHTRIHTGEKPYKCDVCFKSFADRSNWRVHLLAHHGKKAYKCDICQKSFLKRSDLSRHVTVHIM